MMASEGNIPGSKLVKLVSTAGHVISTWRHPWGGRPALCGI